MELTRYSPVASTEHSPSAASSSYEDHPPGPASSDRGGKEGLRDRGEGGGDGFVGRGEGARNGPAFVAVADEEERESTLELLLADDTDSEQHSGHRKGDSTYTPPRTPDQGHWSQQNWKLSEGITRANIPAGCQNSHNPGGKSGGSFMGNGGVFSSKGQREFREPLRRRLSHGEIVDLDPATVIGVRVGGEGDGVGGGFGVDTALFRWRVNSCWYCGAVLLVVGSLVNFASFGFAPQSLLASLGSVQFVSNIVFGKVSYTCYKCMYLDDAMLERVSLVMIFVVVGIRSAVRVSRLWKGHPTVCEALLFLKNEKLHCSFSERLTKKNKGFLCNIIIMAR